MSVAHRTYARALYEAARDSGRLPVVREEMADFAQSVRDVPELRSLLRNPQLDPRVKSRALDDVLGDADVVFRNFVRLLAEKGRIGQLEEIAREFERLAAAEEGQLEVELTTAFEL
ncbi:MAG: ATP synthase F1 subunit delta, partial [Actinomycetota bacterium]|nr:ATP synthase F1 subunit delta [Actinomycetota bacterium]